MPTPIPVAHHSSTQNLEGASARLEAYDQASIAHFSTKLAAVRAMKCAHIQNNVRLAPQNEIF